MAHDIVVVGASAGGVQALMSLVKDLPGNLPAAIFVTQHFPSTSVSMLPQILSRAGKLQVVHPADREQIRKGVIYCAPPDSHLLVHRGFVTLSSGPKENGHRPAIDAMFRTAARAYNSRVLGVILTGMLDDGVAGLMMIKARGGAAIVQDPKDAFSGSMPAAAIKNVAVDRMVSISEMGRAITELVCDGQTSGAEMSDQTTQWIDEEMALHEESLPIEGPEEVPGKLTMFTCPECNGSLWELVENDTLRYRCHVGHLFTEESFLSEKTSRLESALWTALRALQEHLALLAKMKTIADTRGHKSASKRLSEQFDEKRKQADVLRRLLLHGEIESKH